MVVPKRAEYTVMDGVMQARQADERHRPQGRLTTTTVGVLALQGDFREHVRAFERCGVAAVAVRDAAGLDGVDALAVPGGESTTISRLLLSFGLLEPLRHRLAAGMPCFGTCAGLIILSRTILDGRPDQLALGVLDVAVRRNAYGRQLASFEADLTTPDLEGGSFRGVFIRAPQLETAGPEVETLAWHGGRPVAVAQGGSFGLTFHPEMTGDDRFHRLFLTRIAIRAKAAAA